MKRRPLVTRRLVRAIDKGGEAPQLVRRLIAQGADPNVVHRGEPLVFHPNILSQVEMTQALIDGRVDLNTRNGIEETPLHEALEPEFRYYESARALIAAGASLDVESNRGVTPLHKAAGDRRATDILKLMLARRANPNVLDKVGRTALHVAAMYPGNADAIRLLGKHGAKQFQDNRGLLPRDYAKKRGDHAVLNALRGISAGHRIIVPTQEPTDEEPEYVALLRDLENTELQRIPKTERQQLLNTRLGQGAFREKLGRIWRHRCPISGCREEGLLQASHIKPWCVCSNPERLDPFNGLLLAAHMHVAFDLGFISFSSEGALLVSRELSGNDRRALGIRPGIRIHLQHKQAPYINYHREHVYQR